MVLFSEDKEPQQVNVKGRELTCTVCGHDVFKPRKAQLNTKAASLMNLGGPIRVPIVIYVPTVVILNGLWRSNE